MTLSGIIWIIAISIGGILFGIIATAFVAFSSDFMKKMDKCAMYYSILKELNDIKDEQPIEKYSISTDNNKVEIVRIILDSEVYCLVFLHISGKTSKKYDCVSYFNNGYALAHSSDGWRLVNTNFEESFNKSDIAKFCKDKEFKIKDGILVEKE